MRTWDYLSWTVRRDPRIYAWMCGFALVGLVQLIWPDKHDEEKKVKSWRELPLPRAECSIPGSVVWTIRRMEEEEWRYKKARRRERQRKKELAMMEAKAGAGEEKEEEKQKA